MLTSTQQEKISRAYLGSKLKVASVSPDGALEWKRVLAVHRAEIPWETLFEINTDWGKSVLTGGHRIFETPTVKKDTETFRAGSVVLGVQSDLVRTTPINNIIKVDSRQYMYDLTAEDWHNFVLHKSKVVVSNSPDRNYHFRPPTHEETIQQFSRVFGYIWEDIELQEYLLRSLDMVSAAPPRTPFSSVDQMVSYRPEWRTLLLTGAMTHALQALRINWIADEFSVVPETLVKVIVEDEEIDLPIGKLYAILYEKVDLKPRILEAFYRGRLYVYSVVGNEVIKAKVEDVQKHTTPDKALVKIRVKDAEVITTMDHSLFIYDSHKVIPVETSQLEVGDVITIVINGKVAPATVLEAETLDPVPFTYDLSVPGPENFVLSNGLLAHNSYSIGGVSLDLDKSSKYEAAYQASADQFDKQLERSKLTVNIVKGLQQPRFGMGIRSSFGAYVGKGVISPRKFVGS